MLFFTQLRAGLLWVRLRPCWWWLWWCVGHSAQTGTRQCYYYVSCLAAAAAAGTRTVYMNHSLPTYLAATSRVGALFNCAVPQSGLFCGGRVVVLPTPRGGCDSAAGDHAEGSLQQVWVVLLAGATSRSIMQQQIAGADDVGFVACQHVHTHTWGLAWSVLLCYVRAVRHKRDPFRALHSSCELCVHVYCI